MSQSAAPFRFLITFILAFVGLGVCAQSGDLEASEADAELDPQLVEYLQWAEAFEASIVRQTGDIELPGGAATIHMPEGFYYLSPTDAERVLVEAWGNPPSDPGLLGMIFPTTYSPLDETSWGVTIEYVKDGYISDKDAAKIDYDDLLVDLKNEMKASNKWRTENGYEAIEMKDWASAPFYDAETKKLHWAQQLHFAGANDDTLNYNIRILGRHGFLRLNFIAAMSQFNEVDASRDTVLAMTEFNDGFRYADFDPSVDQVAAYGIGALVAGKFAAKAGLFAKFLFAFKKLWIVAIIGIGGLFKVLKGKLGGSEKSEASLG